MKYQYRVVRLWIGSNRQNAMIATAIGLVVGIVVFLSYLPFRITYWLWPSSLLDWGFVVGCILLPTGVTFYRLGLLVAWWMTFPVHFAFAYHFYSQTQFAIPPFQDGLLGYAVLAAQLAAVYGLVGYLLGTAGRWLSNLRDETGIPTRQ